ncbi:MAG: hypothetical protein E2P02_11625 [Acidobacteria bacterium]|nr:MAG: hypothetical protein E2P02_11625 [Acidobacteriota bacterium]
MIHDPETLIPTPVLPTSQCRLCAYHRVVRTKRGTEYVMCKEPTRPRYPTQPVSNCPVFAPWPRR